MRIETLKIGFLRLNLLQKLFAVFSVLCFALAIASVVAYYLDPEPDPPAASASLNALNGNQQQ